MPESEQKTSKTGTSRRRFLGGTVAAAVGLGVASAGSGIGIGEVMAQTEGSGVDEPLGWTPVDTEEIARKARENYYAGMHCAEGVAHTLIQAQRDLGSNRWDEVPSIVAWWGAGGGASNGVLCGTITGACSVTALAYGRSGTTMKIVNELHQRYQQTRFPQYQPPADDDTGMTLELASNRSKSPLCHVSVTEWCDTNGYASGSDERAERCSRVAGETAAHAIELLNAEHAGNFDMVADSTDPMTVDGEKGCRSCHYKGDNAAAGQYTRGKMECMQCHGGAPHMPSSLK